MRHFIYTTVILLSLTHAALAQNPVPQPFYIGVAGSLLTDNYGGNASNQMNFSPSVHLGWQCSDSFAAELSRATTEDFETRNDLTYDGIDIETTMVTLKHYPVPHHQTRGFFGFGMGIMEVETHSNSRQKQDKDDLTEPCAQIVAGVEHHLDTPVSFTGEVAYITGMENLDNVDYFSWSLGLRYRF